MTKDFRYLMNQFQKTDLPISNLEEIKRYSVFPYLHGITAKFNLWVKFKQDTQDNEPSEN